VVHGDRSISADTAIRLGKYFGLPAQFWLNLQNDYDLRIAERSGVGKGIKPWSVNYGAEVTAISGKVRLAIRMSFDTEIKPDPFAPLIGQTANGCWLGYGNMLFLEFGRPQPLRDGQTHSSGEWGLWSDHIEWRIEQRGHIVAGSEDDWVTMEDSVREIDGKTLLSGKILLTGDSILAFTNDLIVRTFVITSEKDARWNFRVPDGKYFHLGPDGACPEQKPPALDAQKLP